VKRPGYKVLRTTLVLAMHSVYLKTIEDDTLVDAMDVIVASNFDLQRVDTDTLEAVYAHFDEATTAKVLGEYTFRPRHGNIRDLSACIGTCNLCGKGDSRDDGDNQDKIRYEFRLTNTAGGSDVWTGSTCIINHHLKVDGAGTSEEARKALQRAFNQHKEEWKREAWRMAYPDHVDIPALFERNRRIPHRLHYYGALGRAEAEIGLLGISFAELRHDARVFNHQPMGAFKKAARWYAGNVYLTPKKQEAWVTAQRVSKLVDFVERALMDAQNITDAEERIAFFRERGAQLTKRRKARALEPEEQLDAAE